MISWDKLVYCIEELEKLKNGNGAEIEFEFKGIEYGITSYKGAPEISRIPKTHYDFELHEMIIDSDYPNFIYQNLKELGEAEDIGFSVKEEWKNLECITIKPDFNDIPLEVILDSYKNALKHRK